MAAAWLPDYVRKSQLGWLGGAAFGAVLNYLTYKTNSSLFLSY
jgi:hypothetical protein